MHAPEPHDLESLFTTASELPPADRAAFLDAACANAPELRAQVEALLAAFHNAGSFLSAPTGGSPVAPDHEAGAPEPPGTLIGPFKLIRQIGEGGFGSVFLAEQSHPIRRRVALKLLKPGMDSRSVAARFDAERQALALMDHPHIARVFDGGLTDPSLGSRPYFVMEYVGGEPITAFAAAQGLSLDARLALFIQVCHAVQHAHTKGVIHRDLKPSNVLVSMTDGRPFARVIDFGIAKATSHQLTDTPYVTEHRQLMGTPEYMSPEQAQGSPDIDTRTDVYGLGVLLYELLTGDTPFDAHRLRSASYAELQRIINNEDPPQPSLRSGPHTRHDDSAIPSTALRGELDWIIMKALEKDRTRRYTSVGSLAADVERYRAHEAVEAAPLTATYRMSKFVRRNKGPVAAAAAIAMTLLLGAAGTAWGLYTALRENRRLTESNQLGRDYLTQIMTELAVPQPASTEEPAPVTSVANVQPASTHSDAWTTVGEAAIEHIRSNRGLRAAAVQKAAELADVNTKLLATNSVLLSSIETIATGLAEREFRPVGVMEIGRVYFQNTYYTQEHGWFGYMVRTDTSGVPRLLYYRGQSPDYVFVPPTELTHEELTQIAVSIANYFGGITPPYERQLRNELRALTLQFARRTIQFCIYVTDHRQPTPTLNDLAIAVSTITGEFGDQNPESMLACNIIDNLRRMSPRPLTPDPPWMEARQTPPDK